MKPSEILATAAMLVDGGVQGGCQFAIEALLGSARKAEAFRDRYGLLYSHGWADCVRALWAAALKAEKAGE